MCRRFAVLGACWRCAFSCANLLRFRFRCVPPPVLFPLLFCDVTMEPSQRADPPRRTQPGEPCTRPHNRIAESIGPQWARVGTAARSPCTHCRCTGPVFRLHLPLLCCFASAGLQRCCAYPKTRRLCCAGSVMGLVLDLCVILRRHLPAILQLGGIRVGTTRRGTPRDPELAADGWLTGFWLAGVRHSRCHHRGDIVSLDLHGPR